MQAQVDLEESVRLVVEAGLGQYVLVDPAQRFDIAELDSQGADGIVERLRPLGLDREVVIDPDRRFGQQVVRAVPTEVPAEHPRAGDTVEMVAELYELTLTQVLGALELDGRGSTAV